MYLPFSHSENSITTAIVSHLIFGELSTYIRCPFLIYDLLQKSLYHDGCEKCMTYRNAKNLIQLSYQKQVNKAYHKESMTLNLMC